MPNSGPDAFPLRPMSTGEVVALQNDVGAFAHTAPYFGLQSLEDGPGTDSQAVVGIYVGFRGGGARLVGYDPEAEDWESVETLEPEEVSVPLAMISAIETLQTWIGERYPDEPLVVYERDDAGLN